MSSFDPGCLKTPKPRPFAQFLNLNGNPGESLLNLRQPFAPAIPQAQCFPLPKMRGITERRGLSFAALWSCRVLSWAAWARRFWISR